MTLYLGEEDPVEVVLVLFCSGVDSASSREAAPTRNESNTSGHFM